MRTRLTPVFDIRELSFDRWLRFSDKKVTDSLAGIIVSFKQLRK